MNIKNFLTNFTILKFAYPDPFYDSDDHDGIPELLINNEASAWGKLFDEKNLELEFEHGDFGTGADWPQIVIAISLGTFFSGKKILDNLDAWEKIFQKINDLLRKIKSKEKTIKVNKDLCILFGIDFFLKNTTCKLHNINRISMNICSDPREENNKYFIDYPQSVEVYIEMTNEDKYIVTVNNDDDLHTFLDKKTGK